LTAELDEKPYRATTVDQEAQLQMAIWTRATQEYEHRLDAFDQQIEHTQAEVATKKADQASLAQRLLVARELEAMRSYLVEREVGSKVNYLDAKSQRMAVERDMQEDQNRILELGRELKQHQAEKAAYLAQFHAKVGEDLVQARRDRDAAAKQLEKAKLRNEITVLAAPADAVVLDIAKRSVGSVLKEAEPLYTLVPLASPLEAEVAVEATDVGHVEVGAEARVKLAAWPFQKYGTLSGRVQTVTEDSFAPEQSAKKEQPDSSEPQKPYYKARVELTSLELRDVPKNFRLLPGLTVSAEIKAGDRSVLSYFLYPILRNLDESIREP
jgi:HlyD family secretion protein